MKILGLGKKGASLIEVLIAAALSGVVATSSYELFISQNRIYSMEGQAEITQREARAVFDAMIKEIRMTGYQSQTADIDEATSTGFTFQTDLDNDGTTDKIRYSLNGDNQVTREAWIWDAGLVDWDSVGGAETVADHVSDLSFTYLDSDGNVTAVLADIAVIHVSLTVTSPQADPKSGEYRTTALSSDITLRNLVD